MKSIVLAAALAAGLSLSAGAAAAKTTTVTLTGVTLTQFLSTWVSSNIASIATGASRYNDSATASLRTWSANVVKSTAGIVTVTYASVDSTGKSVAGTYSVPLGEAAAGLPAAAAAAAVGLWMARRRSVAA